VEQPTNGRKKRVAAIGITQYESERDWEIMTNRMKGEVLKNDQSKGSQRMETLKELV
jgi:hypothetical protein